MKHIKITQAMEDSDEAELTKLCKFFGMTDEQIKEEMFYFLNGEGWNYNNFVLGSTEVGTSLTPGDVVVIRDDKFIKVPKHLAFLFEELETRGKESFFSGMAVSLQSVANYNDTTIASEIVGGLGGEVDDLVAYMIDEGGVDADTVEWMSDNGVVS